MNRPVGPAVDATPAERPGRCRSMAAIAGSSPSILFATAKTYGANLPVTGRGGPFTGGPFANERSFAEWLDQRASLADPFSYASINAADRG